MTIICELFLFYYYQCISLSLSLTHNHKHNMHTRTPFYHIEPMKMNWWMVQWVNEASDLVVIWPKGTNKRRAGRTLNQFHGKFEKKTKLYTSVKGIKRVMISSRGTEEESLKMPPSPTVASGLDVVSSSGGARNLVIVPILWGFIFHF